MKFLIRILYPFSYNSAELYMRTDWVLMHSACGGGTNNGCRDHVNSDAYFLYSHDLYHHYMHQGTCELIGLYWVQW